MYRVFYLTKVVLVAAVVLHSSYAFAGWRHHGRGAAYVVTAPTATAAAPRSTRQYSYSPGTAVQGSVPLDSTYEPGGAIGRFLTCRMHHRAKASRPVLVGAWSGFESQLQLCSLPRIRCAAAIVADQARKRRRQLDWLRRFLFLRPRAQDRCDLSDVRTYD